MAQMAVPAPITTRKQVVRGKHYCAAFGCCMTREENVGMLFASFPKDLIRCQEWIKRTARRDVVPEEVCKTLSEEKRKKVTSTRNLFLCEAHFEAVHFQDPAEKGIMKKRKKLKENAVPTIFNLPWYFQKRTPRRSPKKRCLFSGPTVTADLTPKKLRRTEPEPEPIDFQINSTGGSQPVFCGQSPASTPLLALGNATAQARIRTLNLKIRSEQMKVTKLQARLKELQKYAPCSKKAKENTTTLLSKYLQGPGLELLQCQVDNFERPPHGRRFTDSFKLFALALEAQSPKAYEFLSDVLVLPSKTTSDKMTSAIEVKPGIQSEVVNALEKKVSKISSLARNDVLCIDSDHAYARN